MWIFKTNLLLKYKIFNFPLLTPDTDLTLFLGTSSIEFFFFFLINENLSENGGLVLSELLGFGCELLGLW